MTYIGGNFTYSSTTAGVTSIYTTPSIIPDVVSFTSATNGQTYNNFGQMAPLFYNSTTIEYAYTIKGTTIISIVADHHQELASAWARSISTNTSYSPAPRTPLHLQRTRTTSSGQSLSPFHILIQCRYWITDVSSQCNNSQCIYRHNLKGQPTLIASTGFQPAVTHAVFDDTTHSLVVVSQNPMRININRVYNTGEFCVWTWSERSGRL